MQKVGFTKGPWEYGKDGTDGDYYFEGNNKRIGNMDCNEANARLIASAPGLLQECKSALLAITEFLANHPGYKGLSLNLAPEYLRKAISKAEGK